MLQELQVVVGMLVVGDNRIMEGYIVVAFLGMEKQATAKQLREQELEESVQAMVERDIVLQIIRAVVLMQLGPATLLLPSLTVDLPPPALVRK